MLWGELAAPATIFIGDYYDKVCNQVGPTKATKEKEKKQLYARRDCYDLPHGPNRGSSIYSPQTLGA